MISHKMHPMLSQELYFHIPVFEKKILISGPFSFFFTSPQNGLNLPTLLADAVLMLHVQYMYIFDTSAYIYMCNDVYIYMDA